MRVYVLIIGALALAALAILWFVRTPPARLARQLRIATGVVAGIVAILLITRGAISYALPLATLALWLFMRSGRDGAPQPTPGQTSQVRTAYLEMELDHESGAMRGKVLKGVFAGRELAQMVPAELVLLWRDCRFDDPQSAQLIEAYLDQIHPSWREDMARAEHDVGAGGRMTVEEAYAILGLAPGAAEDDIRRAHKDLLKKLHPDRGGSGYLAAKINAAKDILIGK